MEGVEEVVVVVSVSGGDRGSNSMNDGVSGGSSSMSDGGR